jgi:N-acetylglucosamine-6-phosphate deacetylase
MTQANEPLVFHGGPIVLADRVVGDHRVVVSGGRIEAVEKDRKTVPRGATVIDLKGSLLTPGMVDIHVHGGGGSDFMDATPEAVRTVCQTHLRHGTTTLFPTTTTGTIEQLESMFAACRSVLESGEPTGHARIAGIHLYGPYFAEDKVGCHKKDHTRTPDPKEYQRYFKSGLVKIATCAAELPGAAVFYRAAARNGCLITCGHSNSTYQEMAAAFRAGMRHVDHFWCVMSSVTSLRPRCGTPMQAGMEQFVLVEPEMSTEVIADGSHLSDELLNFAYRMKSAKKLCLVTDSSRALDQPPGKYKFGPLDDGDWFLNDGEVGRTLDGKNLASSVAGMDRMIRTMNRANGGALADTIRMASLTPAELAGVADEVGSIETGKRADLVIWSPKLQIRSVLIGGNLAHGRMPPKPRNSVSRK